MDFYFDNLVLLSFLCKGERTLSNSITVILISVRILSVY